jgi:aminoglycoside phosphotransferase (APT) family kinase protein
MEQDVSGIDAGPVSEWLAANVAAAKAPFEFWLITGGHSNLTYKVVGADRTRFVLRRPPLGAVLATAHDMGREHKIISAVGKSAVPVPAALGLCTDEAVNGSPFYIMSYVDGHVLAAKADVEANVTLDKRRRLADHVVESLATLHLTNPDDIGLGDLGRKEAYLDRQLKRWRMQWENSKTRELPEMEEASELLLQAKPEQKYTGIVHGDYRLGNMLSTSDGRVAAVLDWELCTLGDVLADVGYILNSWAEPGEGGLAELPTAAPGFVTRTELARRYAELTGFELQNIAYYQSFQNWRLAAIVEGVLARYLKGVMADAADTDAFRTQVDRLAAEALRLLRTLE